MSCMGRGESTSLGHHAACMWAGQVHSTPHAKEELPRSFSSCYPEWRAEVSWVFFPTFPPTEEQLSCFDVEQDSV